MAHNEPHLSGDQEQKHRKSGAQVSSPWIANPSISLPVPPSQQYHDQRSKWPAPSNFGDSGFLHGGWGNWPSWQSGAAQSAASETTSPERLALNSSTEAPQPYDLSRYASATSFSPAYPYFQAHTDPKLPTFPPQDPRYGPNPYGMAPMPMPVPGDNRPRSSSATSLSSTDSSNPGGDLLDDLDPTPVSSIHNRIAGPCSFTHDTSALTRLNLPTSNSVVALRDLALALPYR